MAISRLPPRRLLVAQLSDERVLFRVTSICSVCRLSVIGDNYGSQCFRRRVTKGHISYFGPPPIIRSYRRIWPTDRADRYNPLIEWNRCYSATGRNVRAKEIRRMKYGRSTRWLVDFRATAASPLPSSWEDFPMRHDRSQILSTISKPGTFFSLYVYCTLTFLWHNYFTQKIHRVLKDFFCFVKCFFSYNLKKIYGMFHHRNLWGLKESMSQRKVHPRYCISQVFARCLEKNSFDRKKPNIVG